MSTALLILNREGVAIAADSAVTIGSLNVMNTAEKIIPLMNFPNAALVFADSAEYMNYPIKTVLQLFDLHLKKRSTKVEHMVDLAKLFFHFLQQYTFHEDEVIRFIRRNAYFYYDEVFEEGFNMETLQEQLNDMESSTDIKRTNQLRKLMRSKYIDIFRNVSSNRDLELNSDEQEALEELLIELFCNGNQYTDSVNLVFAGYGDHQANPSIYEIDLFGQIDSLIFYDEIYEERISLDQTLIMTTMAQSKMIELMQDGIPLSKLRSMHADRLKMIIDFIKGDSSDSPLKDREFLSFLESKADEIRRFVDRESVDLTSESWQPLYRGLRSQTIDSLAHYVEVLVSVAILNSKYSQDAELFETVGGPVDVATITMIDGFKWRKYKGNHGKI